MGGRDAEVWWVVTKVKTKKQDSTMTEFRVDIYDFHMHPQRANIPLQGLNRCMLTVGATSVPHYQIGALNWYHIMVLHGQKKALWRKQTS